MTCNLGPVQAGQTYTIAVQWQQITTLPTAETWLSAYSGGQLTIAAENAVSSMPKQIYTSVEGGPGDGWQTAVYTFTAEGSASDCKLHFSLYTPSGMMSGAIAIAIDTLTRQQTIDAATQQGTGASASSVFGSASDVDHGATTMGYAVTRAAADSAGHHWKYSNDSGAHWINLDAATDAAALFLFNTDLVRWTGARGTNTELNARAVDNTQASAFDTSATGHLNVLANGGSTPYSANVFTLAANAAPVVFDLNHDGKMDYSHITMAMDGHQVDTAWACANDGILVWNKFDDGQVHDSSQYVFGQKTGSDLSGLQLCFDSNNDFRFDVQDAQYSRFGIWQDSNQNGVVEAGEFKTLMDLGIALLSLKGDGLVSRPTHCVTVTVHSTATLADGSYMLVADATFSYVHNAADNSLNAAVYNQPMVYPAHVL